jgi:hypothetical protein
VRPDLLAERALGERAALPRVDGLAQRRRERLGLGGRVGVADELGPGVGAALDAVEPGGQHRREAEVGVDVGAGDPALDPARLAVADDPEAARAVVATPGDRGRRPALGRVALVGVHGRRHEQRELADAAAQAAEEVAEDVGLLVAVDERAAARVGVDEAHVDVARAADVLLRRLGHERGRDPVEVRDLLDPVLVDRVPVGGGHGVRVADVELVLAVPGLALGELDRDPRALHPAPQLVDERLVHGRREHVVVEDVGDRRREVAVALLPGLGVALAVEVELELGAHHRHVAELARALVLGDEDLARGLDDGA